MYDEINEHGMSVATLHDATAQGDLLPLMQGIRPDVAWVIQPPHDVSPGTVYAFRHGVTTTVLTRAETPRDPEHDGTGTVSRLDTHTHGSVATAQECIEGNVISMCQRGALVTSGPYVHVPPVPPMSGNPIIAMIAEVMGLPLPGGPEQVTQGDQVPGFADLATFLREQGIEVDGSE